MLGKNRYLTLIFAAFFLVFWNYAKVHRGIFTADPAADFPRENLYFFLKDLLTYSVLLWLLIDKARGIPYSRLWDKFIITGLSGSVAFGILALIIDGNLDTGELWDWLPVFASVLGFSYAALVWILVWRVNPVAVAVKHGGVYRIERHPRTMLEAVAVWLRWPMFRGPVAFYSCGWWFGPDPETGLFTRKLVKYRPRDGQRVIELPMHPAAFIKRWERIEGKRWKWYRNCFWMARKLKK